MSKDRANRWVLVHESASVNVTPYEGKKAIVSELFSLERGKGHATELMKKVERLADEKSLELHLTVRAFYRPVGLNNVQLIQFYRRFGFELDDTYPVMPWTMTRPRRNFFPSRKLQGL